MLVTAVFLTACGASDDQDAPPLPAGEQEAGRDIPTPNPNNAIEGMYVLADVANSGAPPVVLSESGDCRVELLDATLRMEAERFAFQNRTREVCGNAAPGEPVMHAAGGTYSVDGGAVRVDGGTVTLSADVGAAFSSARGIVRNNEVLIQELTSDAGAESVSWLFRRDDQQLVPEPGTTGDGDPGATGS